VYKVNREYANYKAFKEDPNIIFLTESEYNRLKDHDFNKPHLHRIRNIFILQCNTGLRVSDIFRLEKHHFEGDKINFMKAFKTKNKVLLPITSTAKKILEDWNYKVPDMEEQVYNRQLKDIARIAGLDRTIERIKEKKGEKVIQQNPLHEILSSHVGVKTFITLCVQKGISPKTVSKYTGKSLDILLKHYYGDDDEFTKKEMNEKW